MLWLIVAMTLLIWLLGVASTTWEGMLFHLLLVAALAMTLASIIHGGKTPWSDEFTSYLRRTVRRR